MHILWQEQQQQHVEEGLHQPDEGVLPLLPCQGVPGLLYQPDEDQLPEPGLCPGVIQRSLQRHLTLKVCISISTVTKSKRDGQLQRWAML